MQDQGSGRRCVCLSALAVIVCTASLLFVSIADCAEQRTKTAQAEKTLSKGPKPGLKPLDINGTMRISESDRCPVCAMRPIKYPKSSCAILLKDGRTFYFCATGCMIRTWMHPEVFLGVDKNDFSLPIVREYFTGRQMDARELKWVAGSDVVGPMGPALVPIDGVSEVAAFKKRHGGKAVFTLEEMNDGLWREITGKQP